MRGVWSVPHLAQRTARDNSHAALSANMDNRDADDANDDAQLSNSVQSPGVVERFLSTLFADRLLTDSPHPAQGPEPSPPTADFVHRKSPDVLAEPPRIPFFPHDAREGTGRDPAMDAPPEDVVFCTEDTVGLRDDKFSVGVIDRSFGDIDSHSPRPQRDYGEDIERHRDVSREDFAKFMRTGIPPRGTVLVSWHSQLKTELVPEARLLLLDRGLYIGDVVKRNSKDPMSGTVIGTKASCTLFPSTSFNGGNFTQAVAEDLSIRGVPAVELINVHEYDESVIVVYGDWVGRIENVDDDVAVKLSNNSVVVVDRPDLLTTEDGMLDRLSVGDFVKTEKGNLRRGRWKYGAFDPNIRPQGTVVETQPVTIAVHWLTRRIGASGASNIEPPRLLSTDELNSPDFFVYDAAGSAARTLPVSATGDRTYHVADVAVGDRVRFKDITAAAVKYDGSNILPNGYPQGKLTRIPRTETLGYDMNVYIVMQTHSYVTVQWQDLSITEDTSPSLIPDPNVEDEDEVWPGEIIYTKEQRTGPVNEDMSWAFTPANVGMVQTVKSRDRLATVRWFEKPRLQFFNKDLIPPFSTGELKEDSEDVSLYDIRSNPTVTRRRGDFVLIHPGSIDVQSLPNNLVGLDWFGEITDLGLDGKITVRLGAAKPVIDVRVPIERVTLAYSSDMDDPPLDNSMNGYSEDEDEEDDVSDFDSAAYTEMWTEYDGDVIDPGNDEDWSTEYEDDDSDVEMPDVEPPDHSQSPETSPELQSDAEKKPTTVNEAADSVSDTPMIESTEPVAQDNTAPSSPSNAPPSFLILDTLPPPTHHYISQSTSSSAAFMRRISKEHKILRTSLPPGIFVRTWESRLDLLRVLMIGPSDTPYEFAPFVIDFCLDSSYPAQPPSAFFHSWTGGNGPVNPNLYEDGKICLSLLGTWHSDERNESWSPTKSTLLQVLVSIMGLVLVKEPYYNEAGYDVHRLAPETKLNSSLYTERTYFRARGFIAHALVNLTEPFAEELKWLYTSTEDDAPRLLDKAVEAGREILEKSQQGGDEERDGLRKISLGAMVMLRRVVEKLEALRAS
ncbi:hypothetical protein P280DRAFT_474726 [Massarina eburnea CBS 473.64]|uniref:UBC core domain-containing protein n=1 Tax=Massarina eburnea CBS 473.64 TaxID=1395130 RepID=A0A6A6RK00_9PLEO|nr:hypothetical protein P280DRAFT_474726 [Massarina eburnea CBS 473.64]